MKKWGPVPKDDFHEVPNEERELVRSHNSRTRYSCACCGATSEHETGTCIVTMLCHEEETCMVCNAGCPPQGNCKSVIEALKMASNWHGEDAGNLKVGSHRRVYGGLRSRTREELAGQWKVRSVRDQPMEAGCELVRCQGQHCRLHRQLRTTRGKCTTPRPS